MFTPSPREGFAQQINSVNRTAGGTFIYLRTNCLLALLQYHLDNFNVLMASNYYLVSESA